MEDIEEFKKDLQSQKEKVDEKIDPILQSYDKGEIIKIELVEKLAEAFYHLEEDEIIIHKMNKPDDTIKLHKALENIFG